MACPQTTPAIVSVHSLLSVVHLRIPGCPEPKVSEGLGLEIDTWVLVTVWVAEAQPELGLQEGL